MPKVGVKPPKTPVTKGSQGKAPAAVPNVCKMPGPPAPFVPTPLPNIGKSDASPKGYTTTVKIEGEDVAIQGATFASMGDVASKGTGGGLVSSNVEGPTSFVAPGAIDVKAEGKSIQLLGDAVTNNGGPSGSPPNASSPAVAQGSSTPSVTSDDPCAAIKAEFNLDVASYRDHKSRKSVSYQSHHVFQDAQLNDFVPRSDAIAILLGDSHSGTEHGTITHERQNKRMRNKGGPGGPASTFGELKKEARADLAAGLEGKRKNASGRAMTKKEAELAADCIVADAEKKAKKRAKDQGKTLTDATPIKPPGGCFPAGTEVWLASGETRPVEALERGDLVRTPGGEAVLTRIDGCVHPMVALFVGGETVRVASYHRVHTSRGLLPAEQLRAGDRLFTLSGVRVLEHVALEPAPRIAYQLGVSHHAACAIGALGLWTDLPDSGPPVVRRQAVVAFVPGER